MSNLREERGSLKRDSQCNNNSMFWRVSHGGTSCTYTNVSPLEITSRYRISVTECSETLLAVCWIQATSRVPLLSLALVRRFCGPPPHPVCL